MSGESERREAGRELDADIAAKVMGGRWAKDGYLYSHVELESGWLLAIREAGGSLRIYEDALPYYSTEIAAAFLVVEAMRAKGYHVSIRTIGRRWKVAFDIGPEMSPEERDDSLPLAISLAALSALASLTPEPAAVQPPPAPTKEAAK